MENRSLVTIAEHSKEKILYLLEMAKQFEKNPNRKILDGKEVATLFFEPSTILVLVLNCCKPSWRTGYRFFGCSHYQFI